MTEASLIGLAALAVVTMSAPAFSAATSEAVGDPARNRVWAGCQLDLNTLNMLKGAVQAGKDIDDPNVDIGVVVIYSLKYTNEGQPLTTSSGGGTTGPIVCIPGPTTGRGLAIEKSTEEEDIPLSEDQGTNATSVDLLDSGETLALRYRVNRTGAAATIKKRLCQTVANSGSGTAGDTTSAPPETNVDCFRVYPE